MIGCSDTKLGYFNNGLVETLMSMLEKHDIDTDVKNDIYTVLNSMLTSIVPSQSTFELFSNQLAKSISDSIKQVEK